MNEEDSILRQQAAVIAESLRKLRSDEDTPHFEAFATQAVIFCGSALVHLTAITGARAGIIAPADVADHHLELAAHNIAGLLGLMAQVLSEAEGE